MTRALLRDEVSRQQILALIGNLSLDGKAWEVEVRRYRKKRSLSQNSLLHKWLGEIAASTGNSIDDVKEAYREMFLGKVAIQLGDEERMVGRSTTKLSTEEMTNFLDQIYAHATQDLGIMLPLPEERVYDKDGRAVA